MHLKICAHCSGSLRRFIFLHAGFSPYSLSTSIMKIEQAVRTGEMRATNAVKSGWRALSDELERQEEALLLEEEGLGLA